MRIKQLTPDRENRPLALIFLGYAFTPECLSSVDFGNYDVSVVYDYQTLEFEDLMAWEKIQNSKREIFLIAWSMGVWAANRFASGLEFQKAVAINGTPFGIHENFGIPPGTFQNSIEHFDFELFKKLKKEGTVKIPFSWLYDIRQYDKAMNGCYMEITKIG